MGDVRIIGGLYRRRIVRFPETEGLRPTPDRVRETLFNWLGQDLTGLACLDLFAGSGALGFEAASRGAARVVMVERSPKVATALRDNARILGAEKVEIVQQDALKFASSIGQRFDVIFLDPPYRQGWIERIAPLLPRIATPDAVVYAEAEHRLDGIGDWQTARAGHAGQVFYQLLRREEELDHERSTSDG